MLELVLVEHIKEPKVFKKSVTPNEFFGEILPRLERRTGILKLSEKEKVDLTHLVAWQLYDAERQKVLRSG